MTKHLQATLTAILVMSTMSVRAQLSTTTSSRPASHTTTVGNPDRPAARSTKRSTARKTTARKAPAESSISRELRELRDQMINQQAQIDALRQQNADKDARLATAASDAQVANASAAAATAQAQSLQTLIQANSSSVQTLSSDVSDLKLANTGLATTISSTKSELNEKIESPATIHYKGVTITPVAFFAIESVYRTRSINSGLNTAFNATPFPGSNQGHISEFNFSGRQSRLGGLLEGNAGAFKLSGYFETDFLSAGITSNSNQSNSYTLRQRQIWGKAETKSGFAVTGGQMWSLVTENGKSTDARTEKLPNTVDPDYMVGYNWTRQPGIRVQQKLGNPILGNAVTIAASLENSQYQFSGSNAPANFIFGGAGTAAGLFNPTANYANSVAPDVLVKVTFDSPHSHVEVGGIARFFRDEIYPRVLSPSGAVTAYAATPVKSSRTGGGVFGSARVSPSRFVDVALQGMAGDGTGRYGSAQLGDVTAHPDGTLEPIHNYHGLFSLETHPTKKLDFYAYYGAEYNQRTTYVSETGSLVGYAPANLNDTGCSTTVAPVVGTGGTGVAGSPATANCASPTRVIQEGTIGYTYRIVNSPKFGRLQYQFTYSYLTRQGWNGLTSGTLNTPTATFGSARATNNLIYGGMRYYIP